ncbi:MAG: transcription-repair coupling factor [Clostridia bacterium]|nr:transcription-repair coupling factor [Clostridia bacterium]
MNPLQDFISKDENVVRLSSVLSTGGGPVAVFGVAENFKAPLISALASDRTALFVASSELEAVRVHAQLCAYDEEALLFLPRDMPLTNVQAVSFERRSGRLAVLTKLALSVPCKVVTCAAALIELLAPLKAFVEAQTTVAVGQSIEPRALLRFLIESGYERVELLEGRGQCALRGDILDVFPPQSEQPYRIEFFGDDIDQIRQFDIQSQRSIGQRERCVLPPACETPQSRARMEKALKALKDASGFSAQREAWEMGLPSAVADVLLPLLYEERACLLDYMPKDAFIFINEPQRVFDEAKTSQSLFLESVSAALLRGEGHPCQSGLVLPADELPKLLSGSRTAAFYTLFRTCNLVNHRERIQFNATSAPLYMGDFETLFKELFRLKQRGEAVLIYCGEAQADMFSRLEDAGLPCARADSLGRKPEYGEILLLKDKLPQGFCLPELRLTVLTSAELFSKQQRTVKAQRRSALRFSDLSVGDFIVHEAHGIGKFIGVEQLTVQNVTRDYLLIAYRGDDKLYIPTDQLNRIQKYIGGGEDFTPPLSKLGSGDWQNRVSRAKKGAKKLAVDLAALYEKRSRVRGFAFSKDGEWQKKLEQRFPYEETPDQLQCIEDIKRDMESTRPMDRLLCGDVGYGKTEVALRAAFKAVQDSKQVALLVPTTILAQQHYSTLASRFFEFPIRMDVLSRFRTAAERKEIKKRLENGQLDIVIGTHALLAKDVRFKDLGLLIIDEEHRFGVNHKERIKELKSAVDVLTLTATPIPRTLNLSMTGIMDISTIDTPPENRYPVQTFVMEYSDALVREALSRELARGGQAFVLSNLAMGMENTLAHLKTLLPEAVIDMAHGQMNEAELENAMERFLRHESDILLCSTIIESGVDFPNANTLIVLDADRLGLAQLYQLRGRVGRSNRMAYAYFTVRQARALSEQAQKRLVAIREFTQFGAGFRLAMRDLEIRGAGTLLGAEQHGHISDIGYEYYCKLMQRAVKEAKGERNEEEIEVTLDIPLDAYIPRDFLPSELMRLDMYRRIAAIRSEEERSDLLDEFFDRYGDLPEPVRNLIDLQLIQALCTQAMVQKISVQRGRALLQFASSASPDGALLIGLLSETAGARLTAAEPMSIEILNKNTDITDIVNKMPHFLSRLRHCNIEEDAI